MTNTILIHGYAGKDLSYWLQWLDKELSQEVDVFFPTYENSKAPNMEEWTARFNNQLSHRGDTFNFIAHSIGCLVTMKLIEQHDINVDHMILVVCPRNKIESHKQLLAKISEEEREIFTKFVEHSYDWELIGSKVEKMTFFFSDDDFAIPYEETITYYNDYIL